MEEWKTNSRKSLSSELRREALMKLLKKMQKTMRISQRQQSNIFLTLSMMMRRKKSPRSFSTLSMREELKRELRTSKQEISGMKILLSTILTSQRSKSFTLKKMVYIWLKSKTRKNTWPLG
jgi:hypothetical protein